MNFRGRHIWLRALEKEDLDFLFRVENDEHFWEISNTITPYSRYVLKKYLDNASTDIFEAKQLRLVICKQGESAALGLIDLYDFDPRHQRAGVGIVIANAQERDQGYATEALKLIKAYAFERLELHQLYAGITEDNSASIRLFEKAGFKCNGVKKQWVRSGGSYKDELFYQIINEKS